MVEADGADRIGGLGVHTGHEPSPWSRRSIPRPHPSASPSPWCVAIAAAGCADSTPFDPTHRRRRQRRPAGRRRTRRRRADRRARRRGAAGARGGAGGSDSGTAGTGGIGGATAGTGGGRGRTAAAPADRRAPADAAARAAPAARPGAAGAVAPRPAPAARRARAAPAARGGAGGRRGRGGTGGSGGAGGAGGAGSGGTGGGTARGGAGRQRGRERHGRFEQPRRRRRAAAPAAPAAAPRAAPAPAAARGGTWNAGNPNGSCAAGVPTKAQAVSTASPTTVVGTGTAASCTFSALQAAVTAGGIITFNCGADPVTIPVTATLNVPSNKNTVIDGGRKITLDGGGAVRILRFYSANFQATDFGLTLQHIALVNGKATPTEMIPTAPAPCSQGWNDGEGGALYMRDGYLVVVDSIFTGNQAAPLGPDTGGGALYVLGSKGGVWISGSTFTNNQGSNAGAVGGLFAELNIYNSLFRDNKAIGHDANSNDPSMCDDDQQRPERDRIGRQRRRHLQRRQRRRRQPVRRRDHEQRRRHERVRRRAVLHQQQLRRHPQPSPTRP